MFSSLLFLFKKFIFSFFSFRRYLLTIVITSITSIICSWNRLKSLSSAFFFFVESNRLWYLLLLLLVIVVQMVFSYIAVNTAYLAQKYFREKSFRKYMSRRREGIKHFYLSVWVNQCVQQAIRWSPLKTFVITFFTSFFFSSIINPNFFFSLFQTFK